MSNPIAHARTDNSGRWLEPHALEHHLQKVSRLAAQFAQPIGPEWAGLAGIWHDLGKYRPAFQHYIRQQTGFDCENAHLEPSDSKSDSKQSAGRVTHSTAGALHAINQLDGYGQLIAYLIAGHHAGLADWYSTKTGRGGLEHRLNNSQPELQESLAASVPEAILKPGIELKTPPIALSKDSLALWLRMLFSCLVDADFLDTESYMQPQQSARRSQYPALSELQQRFNRYMDNLRNNARDSELNHTRQQIFQQCLDAAEQQPGLFSLTVPTGGGKTLSSLGFALAHARKYQKQRIIYAIPYTSIIEQNASVFRQALGEDAVIEHHSNLDLPQEKETSRSRLATENWDAPLIVTTNVQLFESLFAARTSRCRKLHNLANSIIVLDEAQQLPRNYLKPITWVMRQLSELYGVTFVFCTATQPDLSQRSDSFGTVHFDGLKQIREIINQPARLAEQLRRTQVQLPTPECPALDWPQLADQLIEEPCVLAIVNTRKDAQALAELLPDDENHFHLSALMCPEHRSHILQQIRDRLTARQSGDDDRPLRLISTQLIEAGVDIDFPVVYRALAGLDSIAQSAGRCNREGRLAEPGRVIVFRPPSQAPAGLLRQGQQITEELIHSGLDDALAPASFQRYFELLYSKGELDEKGIQEALTPDSMDPPAIAFRTAANNFRLIENDHQQSLVVPWCPPGEEESPALKWLKMLDSSDSNKTPAWLYRKLQRYSINLPEQQLQQMYNEGAVNIQAGCYLLVDSRYHPKLGVLPPEAMLAAEQSVL